MSEQNVALVIGQFESTNARDFSAVVDGWAENMTLASHGIVGIFGQVVTGKQAVSEWFADVFREFASDWHVEVDESRDLGDRVFIVATNHVRGRSSGIPQSFQHSYLYTVRGGKINRMEVWADRAEALEAAGLQE